MPVSFCLFLTATINPGNSVPSLKRMDYKLRENDYQEAIKTWVKYKIPIVFCENSGYQSEIIHKILLESEVPFEYLCFKSTQSHLGKGHGEIEIFNYSFQNSTILNESDKIIKITGRYTIKNFVPIYNRMLNGEADIFINLTHSLTWADSRFFCFNIKFGQELLLQYASLLDEKKGVYFEHILAKSTLSAIVNNYRWSYTSSTPWYQGVYGTDDIKYKNNHIVHYIKNIIFKLKSYLIKEIEF